MVPLVINYSLHVQNLSKNQALMGIMAAKNKPGRNQKVTMQDSGSI